MVRTMLLCAAVTVLCASAARADPVLFAAGDIACGASDPAYNGGAGTATACRQRATSNLILANLLPADIVLALGDVQYPAASTQAFPQGYDPSWGRFKTQTAPVIGNHEGITATTGAGYCAYFGAVAHCNAGGRQGGAAFYSFDVGTWHVVVLNSNCAAAGGCAAGSPQYNWLAADLVANHAVCTLAAWHHPRWSSGFEGSNAFMQPIWKLLYDNGADLVLSGHSHDYERFAPIDGNGAVSADGMRQFVVGTGGVDFTGFAGGRVTGSEARQNNTFGVLRLDLHPAGYDWHFLPEAGRLFTDAGSQACRGAPPPPPPPPPPAPKPAKATLAARNVVKLKKVLQRGILLRVTTDQDASLGARGMVKRKVGTRLKTGTTVLQGNGTAIAGRRATVRLTASPRVAKALRRAFSPKRGGRTARRRLRVTLATSVRTAAGQVTVVRRRVTITR
jgi:hypothetical protein